jgi:hypothetical protein
MSGVPSAFMGPVVLVLLLILVLPEGVVIVLDLLIEPELLVIVDCLLMPAGLVIVLDFTVVRVAGVCAEVVVVFEELLLVWVVAGVWARAAVPPNKLNDTRNAIMRFILKNEKGEKMSLVRRTGSRSWLAM